MCLSRCGRNGSAYPGKCFRVMQDTFEEQTYFEDDENTGLLPGGASRFSGRELNWENPVFTTKEETE